MLDLIRDIRAALNDQRQIHGDLVFFLDDHLKPSHGLVAVEAVTSDLRHQPDQPMQAIEVSERAQEARIESPYQLIEALIPVDSPIRSFSKLEELRAYVAESRLIEIDHHRTNPVFGVGNPLADVMLVGEAPGRDEDLKGEPFVGRAGMLLNKILEAIGFSRDDVYIANILKSRPPNNRDPLPDEVASHIPILYKQIALIQPKIILCLGRISGTHLLKRQVSLSALRGTFHDFHGIPLMVTYHPAALLRNPQWKRPTWEDVQRLRQRYDELVAG